MDQEREITVLTGGTVHVYESAGWADVGDIPSDLFFGPEENPGE